MITVLFHTWVAAFDCPGGGEIQLQQYEKYLAEEGICILRYDPWNPQFDQADIVHHFSSHPEMLFCDYSARVKKLPLVISSIFWPEAKNKYPFQEMESLYRLASRVLPNSVQECHLLASLFRMPAEHFTPIVNGVDEVFFHDVSPELFRSTFDIQGPFVLCMGNIESRKNQLRLIEALKGTGIQLVFAGKDREPEYAVLCRETADSHVHFIGPLPYGSEIQRSAYAAAHTLVLASCLETPGLAALEAAAAGVSSIAITQVGCTQEYFGDLAYYLNPTDTESIREAVMKAWNSPSVGNALREHVRQHFTWRHAAKQLADVYQQVVSDHRRIGHHDVPVVSGLGMLGCNEMELPRNVQYPFDFVHLSGESREVFQSPAIALSAGSYVVNLVYSFLGEENSVHCTLYDTEYGDLASMPLRQGIRQTLHLPFTAESFLSHLLFRVMVPEGCSLIIEGYSLSDIRLEDMDHSSDLVRYSLTKYQQVTCNEIAIPLRNFFMNGEPIGDISELLVWSDTDTVVFGPYIELASGIYTVKIGYSWIQTTDSMGIPSCRLTLDKGKTVLTSECLTPGKEQWMNLSFTLEESAHDFEIVTQVPPGQILKLKAPICTWQPL